MRSILFSPISIALPFHLTHTNTQTHKSHTGQCSESICSQINRLIGEMNEDDDGIKRNNAERETDLNAKRCRETDSNMQSKM